MLRRFEVKFILEVESKTLQEGLKLAKETAKKMMINPIDIKPAMSTRTIRQNSALWLWFAQLAEELNNTGMDMKHFIRQEMDIPWTKNSVHDYLFIPIQKKLFGTKSTTQLDKTEQINKIVDTINRAVIERTKGEVNVLFPSIERLMDEDNY